MKKFVLIDHSIVKTGGHYLEYAQNVLGAAKKDYKIFVATNRKIKDKEPLREYTVLPYYTYDIWGNVPAREGRKRPGGFGLRRALADSRFAVKSKLLFSTIGYALEGRKTGGFFRDDESFAVRILFVLLFVLALPFAALWRLLRVLAFVLKKALQLVGRVFGLQSVRIPKIRRLLGKGKKAVTSESVRSAFEQSTLRVVRSAGLTTGDIVFIPTLSMDDLEGIYRVLQKSGEARRCTWHLVFRRNIFKGREPEYNEQIAKNRKARREFAKFAEMSNVFFYTDTDELTKQYERLCGLHFTTLPIPINPDFRNTERCERKETLTAVYAGDARKEKGYQYLPDIINDVSELTTSGRLRFELQSNTTFKRVQDDPETTAAKMRLLSAEDPAVLLHTNPLNSNQYCKMVRESDIGLLLYDRENYYARSSGALVECLASGIPVVIPSASWLSAQVGQAVRDYQFALVEKYRSSAIPCEKESVWSADSVLRALRGVLLHSRSEKNDLFLAERLRKELADYIMFPRKDDWVDFSIGLYEKAENERFLLLLQKVLEEEPQKSAEGPENLAVFGTSSVKSKLMLVPGEANRLYVEYSLDERTADGVVVRLCADFIDEYGYSIEKRSIEHVSQEDTTRFTNLFTIPQRAGAVEISLSTPYYDAPAFCVDTRILFWRSPEAEPISSMAYIYVSVDEVPYGLKEIVNNYEFYRDTAKRFSQEWNRRHTSEKLIDALVENAEGAAQ